jgi:hypothetical protein
MAIDSRVDAVEKQYPEPAESPILALVPTAVELTLPHASLFLKFAELIKGHFSAKERQERAAQLLAILHDHERLLDEIGKRGDALKVRVDDLAEAIQIAAWRDAEAFNDAKRNHYVSIIGNAVRSDAQIDDVAAFIRDVEQMTERDLAVLKVLNRVMNQQGDWKAQGGPPVPTPPSKVHPQTFMQRRQEMAVAIAEALGMETNVDAAKSRFNPEVGYSVCARLQGFGLAHEIQVSPREVPIGDYCFRPSQRGLMLLKLLGDDVPNWEHYFPAQTSVAPGS